MNNELTKKDLELMQAELDERRLVLRPKLIEAVKEARAFGDLSENFEYKAAKQEKNRNDGRIRYLENMIKTAKVIGEETAGGGVGLYDKVTVWLEEDEESMEVRVVTTVRQDAGRGFISKESPFGRALLGKQIGERFYVEIDAKNGYYARVDAIEKESDDGSAPLMKY